MILLPLIQVELVSETENLTTIGLLDSGATTSFVPYEIADILEALPKKTRKSVGVETAGGRADFVPTTLRRVSLLAGGKIFSDFRDMQVLVPPDPRRDLPYVILGRDPLFDRFYVTFKEKIKKFIIEHHKWARAHGR